MRCDNASLRHQPLPKLATLACWRKERKMRCILTSIRIRTTATAVRGVWQKESMGYISKKETSMIMDESWQVSTRGKHYSAKNKA